MASDHETIFTMEATPVKFGSGASDDAGWELKRLGVRRVMLVTDPGVAALGHPDRIKGLIETEGIEVVVYDRSRVEPTIESFQDAADFALEQEVDGFVSVGGGSSMDTAKTANLVSTHPAPVMDYVNPPVGEGRKPPSPLKPHLAIPTTSGTGSEATTVAVLDIPDIKVKSGISHRYLRATQATGRSRVDPLTALGGDVVDRARRRLPRRRVVSDQAVRCPRSARLARRPASVPGVESDRRRVVGEGARARRPLSASRGRRRRRRRGPRVHDAGGDDGGRRLRLRRRTHPARLRVSDRVGYKHEYQPPGYPEDHPFVPHGHSVIVTAPAAFRFTYDAMPERHHHVAELLAGGPIDEPGPDTLPEILLALMRDVDAPRGVAELGYGEDDIPQIVDGALKQQRLLAGAPKEVTADDLRHIVTASMSNWSYRGER